MMLAGTLAELLTIGATLPFLALIATTDPSQLAPPLRWAIALLGPEPIVTASLLLIAAAVFAAAIRLFLMRYSQRFTMAVGHELAARIFHNMLRQPYAAFVRGNTEHREITGRDRHDPGRDMPLTDSETRP